MSMRYISNAAVVLLGGLVVVLSVGLHSAIGIRWASFAIAIGIVGIAGLAELDRRLAPIQRVLDLSMVAAAGTLIAITDYFGGTTLKWLAFALALGTVGVAFAGLTLHEVETWRASHRLGQLHWLASKEEVGAPTELPKEAEIAGPRAA